ncbi:hypothetical protein GcM3_062032 [Golovinomyces cichoracearum]|uniref:Uncharacterized protein n=1 Tax=Golovinomyces cichoracearum TaxID=62708 RepID=A0A420IVQ8_9PEZI|nr:hypothetical protein GcM3_062032 [Golovinomyces cichoracearum]
MIRLAPDYKARKAGFSDLGQKIQELVTGKSLASDVWNVPSRIAILAPNPAKAATLTKVKITIQERLGNTTFERQENWTFLFLDPFLKESAVSTVYTIPWMD